MTSTPFVRPLVAVWLFATLALTVYAWPAVTDFQTGGYLVVACLVQASLFSLPTLILVALVQGLKVDSGVRRLLIAASYLVSFLTVGFLLANFKLYSLYGFFTNFFVINIVSTPGGIEAMGISSSTWVSLALATAALAVVYGLPLRFVRLERVLPRWLRKRQVAIALLACFVVDSAVYAYAEYQSNLPVLGVADRIVWHTPVTAKSFFQSLGIKRRENLAADLHEAGGRLDYDFSNELATRPDSGEPINIVWLVAESWRADMVTPEIMPATYDFARDNQWFANHYSGGNGTRMGMFTQFYGIYGNYWFDMLRVSQPPLLMQYLKARNYDVKAFTSSAFTYPEFDRTVFSNFASSQLQEFNEGEGWQRDQKNTTDLIRFINKAREPFFSFMFFESAHANYYFPDEDIIEPDYLEDFNYLTVDVEDEIDRIRNRYVNSVHHLDRQLARVYRALERRGLLDNTLVVVTGDHGEEFMENGRWGHNSTFSQQQIRVPLILHVPERAPAEFTAMTSHLDLPATVLNLLGYQDPDQPISHGQDLLSPDYNRDFSVVSDWHGNTLVTDEAKMVFSLKGASMHATVTTNDDQPMEEDLYASALSKVLGEYTTELNRFYN
ncbi:MAG: sulfatase-like hydrolase/transferase [Gammaproteobacteria bacterium]|nr:sulfatase-like hydrolase/transferase [Pseudomonadales bacterium]